MYCKIERVCTPVYITVRMNCLTSPNESDLSRMPQHCYLFGRISLQQQMSTKTTNETGWLMKQASWPRGFRNVVVDKIKILWYWNTSLHLDGCKAPDILGISSAICERIRHCGSNILCQPFFIMRSKRDASRWYNPQPADKW